ncbi:MAG: preprotein translocase subunit SecG [Clostridia bacterium]|nr:preprotein translocase subunit SecG [Clostridia bacterium]
MILEYILLSILLVCAVVIVVAVTLQKSNEGLSGTISGGSETYYGKDKSVQTGKKIFKITLIASIIFAVAVLVVYVIQPDYAYTQNDWTKISEFSSIFGD